ncbi:HAMP domain-containing protein [Massilia sp. RP-1-19]|uniref:histidine kinase n=1 Tax=Massilia polaris TaxID=2728846 RepID=A0A848HF24_9BURK|nr:ATP-binding protein [Massilia polaris]NML59844.1 HAMP domain-containing protein [Massilia polaris]
MGLVLAQSLSVWLTMTERDQATMTMMMGYIEREVASSVALLDHLPPQERVAWLPRLARRSYEFVLDPGVTGSPPDALLSAAVAQSIAQGIGKSYALTANAVPGARERLQVHLQLSDGTPLTIDIRPMSGVPVSRWLPLVLLLQVALLGACVWLAVRLATRPLHQLAMAADTLGPDLNAARLPEDGPAEVAIAARAFNAMQDRIATYMTDRMQILAAISHDLQTPITRMRLRLDLMEDRAEHVKLRQDLHEMETLVREGVVYARTLHGSTEAPCKVDIDALLDIVVCDYTDAGKAVTLHGRVGAPMLARPQALRRVIGNLTDNALKFAGMAELSVSVVDGLVAISVLDRGPGIPAESLDAVFEPFHRLEDSRNRDTGGTGLGLAIARQLTLAMDGELSLHNREGGGLEARLLLKGLASR